MRLSYDLTVWLAFGSAKPLLKVLRWEIGSDMSVSVMVWWNVGWFGVWYRILAPRTCKYCGSLLACLLACLFTSIVDALLLLWDL